MIDWNGYTDFPVVTTDVIGYIALVDSSSLRAWNYCQCISISKSCHPWGCAPYDQRSWVASITTTEDGSSWGLVDAEVRYFRDACKWNVSNDATCLYHTWYLVYSR